MFVLNTAAASKKRVPTSNRKTPTSGVSSKKKKQKSDMIPLYNMGPLYSDSDDDDDIEPAKKVATLIYSLDSDDGDEPVPTAGKPRNATEQKQHENTGDERTPATKRLLDSSSSSSDEEDLYFNRKKTEHPPSEVKPPERVSDSEDRGGERDNHANKAKLAVSDSEDEDDEDDYFK